MLIYQMGSISSFNRSIMPAMDETSRCQFVLQAAFPLVSATASRMSELHIAHDKCSELRIDCQEPEDHIGTIQTMWIAFGE